MSISFSTVDGFPIDETIREIAHPVSVRSLTPRYIAEDHPNPSGVRNVFDPTDSPKVPVSTKIHQMIDGKRQQCEPAVINIVAFGVPYPMHDGDVNDALLGAIFGVGEIAEDSQGIRQMGEITLQRAVKAPFVSASKLANEDDQRSLLIRSGKYRPSGASASAVTLKVLSFSTRMPTPLRRMVLL